MGARRSRDDEPLGDGLRRVHDGEPGLKRQRRGDGFRYLHPDGRAVGAKDRARIQALAIPPAWSEVWICRDARGHLQATGRDDRGRKQYLYHDDFRRDRDEDKFGRLAAFGAALPDLRDVVHADLEGEGASRERVVAAVVRILDRSFTRVGSARYARDNGSYGISTLGPEHVDAVTTRSTRLRFPGKGNAEVEVALTDARVADVVGVCLEMEGPRLFEYVDDEGGVHPVGRDDVNEYLAEATGGAFTAKDFRTWAATTLMLHELTQVDRDDLEPGEREAAVRRAVEAVAERLGNTPAVCKGSYIHPAVPAAFLAGELDERTSPDAKRPADLDGDRPALDGLMPEEVRTLRLLRSYEADA